MNKDLLIESNGLEQRISKHFTEDQIDKVNEYIPIIENINILRQGKCSYPMEKCRVIFLSEGNISNDLSHLIRDYYSDNKPQLITRMSVFTELLWFKLKKGVVNTDSSITFSVVNKAKTIVSGLVHEHLIKEYNEVVNLDESDETKKAYYADLRGQRYSPDDISSDTIADDVAFINNTNYFEEYKRAQDILKKQAAKSDLLEKELEEEKKSKQQILEKLESNTIETEELKTQLERERDEKKTMNDRIATLEENLAKEKQQRKKLAIAKARKKIGFHRFIFRFGWVWVILTFALLFVVPPLLWMKHELATIYTVVGVFISLAALIIAIKRNIKTTIRIRYIKRYKKVLAIEMDKMGVC